MHTEITNTHYVLNAPYVVHETIEGETIVMNLKNGFYYSFDGLGPAIWELLLKGAGRLDVITTLKKMYPTSALDIPGISIDFLEELRNNDIILKKDDAGLSAPLPPVADLLKERVFSEIAMKPPLFHSYTDMRDVLLLDPIHDVDVKGWPEPKLK